MAKLYAGPNQRWAFLHDLIGSNSANVSRKISARLFDMISFLKVLAFCGLSTCSLALVYILWVTFGGGQGGLHSAPSFITIISLVCLLGLWADRLYRVLTRSQADHPIPLERQWAKDGLVRLLSWISGLVASGAVLVAALVIFSAELALPLTVAGSLLFGGSMFLLEQRYLRSRAGM